MTELTVIMPALNEGKNLSAAADNVLKAFPDCGINGELIIINDGSSDSTGEITAKLATDSRVKIITHACPEGIGASFWEGVDAAAGETVVLLPGDNENDPWEIFRYLPLMAHVDMVIPFVYNKQARPLYRNALSFIYRFIINTTFLVYFNYTNGTVLYRKSLLKELDCRSTGFFFQTDILIRAAKRGYLFAQVPYKLGLRKAGLSKAVSFPSLLQVINGYIRLVRDQYFSGKAQTGPYAEGSATRSRRNQPSNGMPND